MTKENPLQWTLQEWTTLTPEAPTPNLLQLLSLFCKLNLQQNVSEVWLLAKGPLGSSASPLTLPQGHGRRSSTSDICPVTACVTQG